MELLSLVVFELTRCKFLHRLYVTLISGDKQDVSIATGTGTAHRAKRLDPHVAPYREIPFSYHYT